MSNINVKQTLKVVELVKNLTNNSHGLNFYSFGEGNNLIIASDMYPPLNHPQAIEFFFFVCMHQFGFWTGDKWTGYIEPLYGTIDGKKTKGSDLLWKVSMRALKKNPDVFSPEHLAEITQEELLEEIFADDSGPIPFPDRFIRLDLTRTFGKWFVEEEIKPSDIVRSAQRAGKPLSRLLDRLRKIPGYSEDPLEKKNLLLAMAMANRPEKFIEAKDFYNWLPVVDYHLMRVALRLGLVDLHKNEIDENEKRQFVSAEVEKDIRTSVYDALIFLIRESGRGMPFIDELMWSARKYCPEMEEPDCSKCVFTNVCKKRTKLFQPVFRTTYY